MESSDRTPETSGTGQLLADGYRLVRRFVVFVLGISVLAVGTAMLLLPGPAFLVIPAGLGILALEFEWARRLLRRVREESSAFWKTRDDSGEDATSAEADAVSEKARGE
ncbi:MAG: PGPGW domain-containing protein [Myxococcota bacterium]